MARRMADGEMGDEHKGMVEESKWRQRKEGMSRQQTKGKSDFSTTSSTRKEESQGRLRLQVFFGLYLVFDLCRILKRRSIF
jgi:hypothetical protein